MTHSRKIFVIGLGNLGFPVALVFSKLGEVIGCDENKARVPQLKITSL